MTQQLPQTGKTSNRRLWQAHVHAFHRSGLSRAEYCRQNNLSYHALTYWQRKLSNPRTAKKCSLVPVSLQPAPGREGGGAASASLRLILPGGCTVEVADLKLQNNNMKICRLTADFLVKIKAVSQEFYNTATSGSLPTLWLRGRPSLSSQ